MNVKTFILQLNPLNTSQPYDLCDHHKYNSDCTVCLLAISIEHWSDYADVQSDLDLHRSNISSDRFLLGGGGGGGGGINRVNIFSRNKKNYVYLCKPQFYYVNVGFKGVKII